MLRGFIVVCLCWGQSVFATEPGERAHLNYMLYCQGCHTPAGMGAKDAVPRLNGQIGYFLQVAGGREYLVQVPGSASSVLNDHDLAMVLNWMVNEFAGESLPDDLKPFTAGEVGRLRETPVLTIGAKRTRLVVKIDKELNKTIR